MFRRVSPQEARELQENDGYVYVDVRSVPEFQAGHPMGAFNVPLMHMGPAGMAPNPEFLDVMQKAFPRDAKLLVGC
jgi:rhodanese-related sulfurtransferase